MSRLALFVLAAYIGITVAACAGPIATSTAGPTTGGTWECRVATAMLALRDDVMLLTVAAKERRLEDAERLSQQVATDADTVVTIVDEKSIYDEVARSIGMSAYAVKGWHGTFDADNFVRDDLMAQAAAGVRAGTDQNLALLPADELKKCDL